MYPTQHMWTSSGARHLRGMEMEEVLACQCLCGVMERTTHAA